MNKIIFLLMSILLMICSPVKAENTDRLAYIKLSTEKTKNPEEAAKSVLELNGDASLYAILEVKQNSGYNSLIVYGLAHPNDGEPEYHGRNMSLRFLIDGSKEGFIRFSTEDIDYQKGDKWFSMQVLPGNNDAEVFYADALIKALLEIEPGKHKVELYTQDSEHVSFTIDTSSGRSTLEDGVFKVWANRSDSTKVPEREANPEIEELMLASMKNHHDVSPFGVILGENKWYIEQNGLGITESRSVGGYKIWQFKADPRKCELYGPVLFRQFMVGGKFTKKMDTGILGTTAKMDIPCKKLEGNVYRGGTVNTSVKNPVVAEASSDRAQAKTVTSETGRSGNGGMFGVLSGFQSIIALVLIISNLAGGLIAAKPLIFVSSFIKENERFFSILDNFRVVIGLTCLVSGLLLFVISILGLNFSFIGVFQQIISIALGLLFSFTYLVSRKLPVATTDNSANTKAVQATQKAQDTLKKYEAKVKKLEIYAVPIGITAIALSIFSLII